MLDISAIQAAQERIAGRVAVTPCVRSDPLSERTGCEIHLKLENLQLTGSFKARGALNKILQLSADERARGVVTASAGNHAQAVAYAARAAGSRAVVVMPESAPLTKVRGTMELNGQVVLHGGSFEAAYEHARKLETEHGYTFVHAFDDPQVMAGQGTIGLELLTQVPAMDAVIVPVGGGGLISGISVAIKGERPQVEVIGVEAKNMPAMQRSIAAGAVATLRPANTIADGICIARVGEHTYPVAQRYVSAFATAAEQEIANAIMTLLEQEKSLAEGAGAAGLAALLHGHIPGLAGKRVVVVISGGNIDLTRLSLILERALETDQRLARLKVIVADRPGSVAAVAEVLTEHHASILNITQNRHVAEVELGESELELALETRGREHVQEITATLRAQGFRVKPGG